MVTPTRSRPLISIPVLSQRMGERISILLRLTPRLSLPLWCGLPPLHTQQRTPRHIYPSIHHARLPLFPRETQLTLSPQWLAFNSLSLRVGLLSICCSNYMAWLGLNLKPTHSTWLLRRPGSLPEALVSHTHNLCTWKYHYFNASSSLACFLFIWVS